MAGGWGPPPIDFSPIGNLANTFFDAQNSARKRRLEDLQLQAGDEFARLTAAELNGGPSAPSAPSGLSLSSIPAPPAPQAPRPPTFAGGGSRPMTMPASPELAQAIKEHATAAGIDPVDLATAISYETAGTFDPWKAGPRTQWGQHRGLIQWGEPQAKQYGVTADMPVGDQVAAAVKYLQDRGVKPGHGLMDIYSAINAGSVGRYNASDANNGGAPGTVADKVNNQMGAHRQKAMALLGASAADAPAPGAQNAQFQIPGQERPNPQALAPVASQPPQIEIPAFIRQGLQSQNPYVRQKAAEVAQKYIAQRQEMAAEQWKRQDQRAYEDQVRQQGWSREDQIREATQAREDRIRAQTWSREDENRFNNFVREDEVRDKTWARDDAAKQADRQFTREQQDRQLNAPTPAVREFEYGRENPEFVRQQLERERARATRVNVGGESSPLRAELSKDEGKIWGNHLKTGTTSAGLSQDFQVLDELMKVAPQGPIVGQLAQAFPGVSSAGAAFQSIIKRVAPSLRTEGSGATSDIEYEGMLQSLPSLGNRPEANRMIADTMKAKAQLNIQRGSIVTRYQNNEIDEATARRELDEINKVSILAPELKQIIQASGSAAAPGFKRGDVPAPPRVGDLRDGYRFKGGNPADPSSWHKVQ